MSIFLEDAPIYLLTAVNLNTPLVRIRHIYGLRLALYINKTVIQHLTEFVFYDNTRRIISCVRLDYQQFTIIIHLRGLAMRTAWKLFNSTRLHFYALSI